MPGARKEGRSVIDAILDQVEDRPGPNAHSTKLYRAEALEHLDVATDVDKRLVLVTRRSWLAIVAIGVIIACGLIWAALTPSIESVPAQGRTVSEDTIVLVMPESRSLEIEVGMAVEIPGTTGAVIAEKSTPMWSDDVRDELMLNLPGNQPMIEVTVIADVVPPVGTPVAAKIITQRTTVMAHLVDRS